MLFIAIFSVYRMNFNFQHINSDVTKIRLYDPHNKKNAKLTGHCKGIGSISTALLNLEHWLIWWTEAGNQA